MTDKSKAASLSRSSFLQGRWNKHQTLLRPPWAVDEAVFMEHCANQCDACRDACPEKIIVIGRGHYPHIDFSQGECTFCQQCVDSCQYGALDYQQGSTPWNYKAAISQEQCITQKSVVCRSCSENCDAEAILFHPQLGGVSSPDLKQELCTGCGACVQVCPTKAVSILTLIDPDQG